MVLQVKRKTLINDIGSEVVLELVQQLNDAVYCIPIQHTAPIGMATSVNFIGSQVNGFWIKDIILAVSGLNPIITDSSAFVMESDTVGNWTDLEKLYQRAGFGTYGNVAASFLGTMNNLAPGSPDNYASLPIWLPPGRHVRMTFENAEIDPYDFVYYIIGKPIEWEYLIRPQQSIVVNKKFAYK